MARPRMPKALETPVTELFDSCHSPVSKTGPHGQSGIWRRCGTLRGPNPCARQLLRPSCGGSPFVSFACLGTKASGLIKSPASLLTDFIHLASLSWPSLVQTRGEDSCSGPLFCWCIKKRTSWPAKSHKPSCILFAVICSHFGLWIHMVDNIPIAQTAQHVPVDLLCWPRTKRDGS